MGYAGKPYSKHKFKKMLAYFDGSYALMGEALEMTPSNLSRIYNGGTSHAPTHAKLDEAYEKMKNGGFSEKKEEEAPKVPFGALLHKIKIEESELDKSILARLEGKLNELTDKVNALEEVSRLLAPSEVEILNRLNLLLHAWGIKVD